MCNSREYIKIAAIIFFVIILYVIIKYVNIQNVERMIGFSGDSGIDCDGSGAQPIRAWSRNKCNYVVGDTFEKAFTDMGITRNDGKWNLYLPCSYDNPEKELAEMPVTVGAKYFIIDNVDTIVAKDCLWKNLVKHYGLARASIISPRSYILQDASDMGRFANEYDKNKIYIMKKNIQRQEGLKITKNKDDIISGNNKGYVIAQELLQNPYLIDGRKTNMRFYVLMICQNKNVAVYVHGNGFMYYTKGQFKKGALDTDTNITTGYIDRNVYVKNPLTHQDLREFLDTDDGSICKMGGKRLYCDVEKNIRGQGLSISKVYFDRIYRLLHDIFISFVGNVGTLEKFSGNMMFQLFGVDIAVDDQLNPMVMEINKGPDMNAKDERDAGVKYMVVKNMLDIVNKTGSQCMLTQPLHENMFVQVL